jgi:hypothetical protein
VKTIVATFLIILLFHPATASSEIQKAQHTTKQTFGDSQSPDDASISAIAKAKRETLEKAGIYINCFTVVENCKIEKDEILALTAGVLKKKEIMSLICNLIVSFMLTIIGIIIALWYGNLGKPKLVRDPSPDEILDAPISSLRRRSLRISIKNVPKKFPFVIRKTAVSCHGEIVFLDKNKKPVSKPMKIRWTDSPEPIKQLLDLNIIL